MSEQDGVFPLDDKEKAVIAKAAHQAGSEAKLEWAHEHLPVSKSQAPGNASTIATWLMAAEGKIGRKSYPMKNLYKEFFTGSITVYGSCEVRVYEKKVHSLLSTFGPHQVKAFEDLAALVARGLCMRNSLDEVSEVSRATWSVYMQSVRTGNTAQSLEFLFTPTSRFQRAADSDTMLIKALEALGHARNLNAAYKGAHDKVVEEMTETVLADVERHRRLERKASRKESRDKALSMARTGISKLRSKDE